MARVNVKIFKTNSVLVFFFFFFNFLEETSGAARPTILFTLIKYHPNIHTFLRDVESITDNMSYLIRGWSEKFPT